MDNGALLRLLNALDSYPVQVSSDLRLRMIPAKLLRRLGLAPEQVRNQSPARVFSIEAFQDLFVRRALWRRPFKNYRAFLRGAGGERVLCQVSGLSAREEPRFRMLIQEIPLPSGLKVDVGEYEASVRANRILQPYISRHLRTRATSAARAGLDAIPDEQRDFTFLFADLVSYTSIAERSSPAEVVDLLNLSIGATTATIVHSGGFVDKIMGDSIFAVFSNSQDALVAAIEIQKQFNILNLFRVQQGQHEINLRIGVHSGACLLATLGSDQFRELTFIGDAVNVAARLEHAALPGTVLASRSTIEPIQDRVEVSREEELNIRGKTLPLRACYINRLTFDGPRGRITIGFDDDPF
ncbi:MAG: adenylate/guanylate cyclase domain-containing protein [Leptospirales bacterium]|nr:adenylate/guanylate cyclase domain-containing protein [Leptospirales bacterium]